MLRRILLWLLPTVTVLVCGYLYGMSGRYATTDNAYLQQDRVDVVAQIPGNVSSVEAMENSAVKAGQVILTLEDATQRMLVAAAESKLDAARADVRALQAAIHEKTGELEVARRAAEFSDRDLKRQKELADRKLISVAQLDSAERTAELSSGSIAVLKLQLAQTLARLGGNANAAVDSYPVVANALADLARARLDLDRTVVRAPQAGIVSHLPKVGSRLDMGRTAFAIITTDRLWVEANFKETDLEWVRPGQRVTVDVDTYSHRHWTGHVESIAQATGSSFALLPAQNASGNWVKVVQRIPVRIALDRRSDDPPLRNGMSASVSIDTGGHTRIDRWLGR
jgi:membrane fusion protein (multidrug efflux system)